MLQKDQARAQTVLEDTFVPSPHQNQLCAELASIVQQAPLSAFSAQRAIIVSRRPGSQLLVKVVAIV
jgi:hypothetical protein